MGSAEFWKEPVSDRIFLGYDKVPLQNMRLQSGKIVDGVDGINGKEFLCPGVLRWPEVDVVGMVNGYDTGGKSRVQRSVSEPKGASESTWKLAQLPEFKIKSMGVGKWFMGGYPLIGMSRFTGLEKEKFEPGRMC